MTSSASDVSLVSLDEVALVSRSPVPENLPYTEYKQYLRRDFFHSCAYCTMSESEAQAIRFTIDHYEPQKARPDLEREYNNLMWACDECNRRKGDRTPPAAARASGIRFFRPDQDYYLDHFEREKLLLKSKTKTGWYSIEALDLNREGLQRLRDLRQRLTDCEEAVTAGVVALTKFPIDGLPSHLKGPATRAVRQIRDQQQKIVEAIEGVLRDHAKSPFLDDDASVGDRGKERARKLKSVEAMYPGDWRGPRKKKA